MMSMVSTVGKQKDSMEGYGRETVECRLKLYIWHPCLWFTILSLIQLENFCIKLSLQQEAGNILSS